MCLGAAREATAQQQYKTKDAEAQHRAAAKLGTRPASMQCAMGAAVAFVWRKKALITGNRASECVAEGHVSQLIKLGGTFGP